MRKTLAVILCLALLMSVVPTLAEETAAPVAYIMYADGAWANQFCSQVLGPDFDTASEQLVIDADAFAERIKSIIERQGYDDLTIGKFLTVGDVLNAVIADLKGMTLYGYENAPTVIEAEEVEE